MFDIQVTGKLSQYYVYLGVGAFRALKSRSAIRVACSRVKFRRPENYHSGL